MLGNDIVDLQLAAKQSNWRRKGYLQKIFTEQEQELILNATDQDQMVWLLWSMKEAAYKIVNRENLKRFYSPKKFSCTLYENIGTVNFEDNLCYTKSEITEKLIHTIASSQCENLFNAKTSFLANTANYLSDFNSNSKLYILEKDANGIPNLVAKTNAERYSASVSHHGDYLAVVSEK